MSFYEKYLKYKNKYLKLLEQKSIIQKGGDISSTSVIKNKLKKNLIKIKPYTIYIKSTFTPNYQGNPLSDHGALNFKNIVIWNITQKGYKMKVQSNDNSIIYTHKFMNIKNESDIQYSRRCLKIKHKIFDIIRRNPNIDILLLQELPSDNHGDVFHNNMSIDINDKKYVLLCNYEMVKWPNGIFYNSTKYKAKQIFTPSGLIDEEYNRMAIFVLTEYVHNITKIYISVHSLYKNEENRDQELIDIMDVLVKNLVKTLPYNISSIIFGGDFNNKFSNGLFSEFKNVSIFSTPPNEIYSTTNNYGKRNDSNIDYIIIYKLF